MFKFFYNLKNILFIFASIFILSCNNNSTSPFTVSLGITVNPYGVTPLSAIYVKTSVNTAPVTVKVKGLYGEPDIIYTYPAGYGTEFEIHGMFPESDNVIEVNDGISIITKNVTVGSLSYNGTTIQKKYDVAINNLPEEKYPNNPDIYFISLSAPSLYPSSLGVSKNGYLRYVNNQMYSIRVIYNNSTSFLWCEKTGIATLAGKYILKYPNSIKAHHDSIKYNNQYLSLSKTEWGTDDGLTIINSSGNVVKELRFSTLIKDIVKDPSEISILNEIVFDENNKYLENGVAKAMDWFHANSLVYDSSTDILYVSSRHRGVLAIDYSEWKLIWWMADNDMSVIMGTGYGEIIYDKHFEDLPSLKPYRVMGDGATDGPRNQHALFLLANGNLGMFDNQVEYKKQSRYIEYQITKVGEEYHAKIIDNIKVDNLHAHITSDVDFIGENYENLLLTFGSDAKTVVELEKNTRKKLFQCSINFGAYLYRADKMPLYYDEGRVYSEDCNLKNPN